MIARVCYSSHLPTLGGVIDFYIAENGSQKVQNRLLRHRIKLLLTGLIVVALQKFLSILSDKPDTYLRERDLGLVLLQEHEQFVNLMR